MKDNITALRMERQFFTKKANTEEYTALYRDTQPGYNVYWNGFGQPPTLTFRADFDDLPFNKERQLSRDLIKGRFCGGNLGWIEPCDLGLFAALYKKDIELFTPEQQRILTLTQQMGALTIQQIKEETGYLVKEITPVLHRLQEAFLIYEDQYDGEWDRGWCLFSEMFPEVDTEKLSRTEALETVLQRFAYRNVVINSKMARSFYKLPEKDIKTAISTLCSKGVFAEYANGYCLASDIDIIENTPHRKMNFVYAMHRNDFLVKSFEYIIKEKYNELSKKLPYDHDILQYLLIDGEFAGAVVGHFRNGPYDLNDVICEDPNVRNRKDEIINAVKEVNFGKAPLRFMGKEI